jgi:hypothetical protein
MNLVKRLIMMMVVFSVISVQQMVCFATQQQMTMQQVLDLPVVKLAMQQPTNLNIYKIADYAKDRDIIVKCSIMINATDEDKKNARDLIAAADDNFLQSLLKKENGLKDKDKKYKGIKYNSLSRSQLEELCKIHEMCGVSIEALRKAVDVLFSGIRTIACIGNTVKDYKFTADEYAQQCAAIFFQELLIQAKNQGTVDLRYTLDLENVSKITELMVKRFKDLILECLKKNTPLNFFSKKISSSIESDCLELINQLIKEVEKQEKVSLSKNTSGSLVPPPQPIPPQPVLVGYSKPLRSVQTTVSSTGVPIVRTNRESPRGIVNVPIVETKRENPSGTIKVPSRFSLSVKVPIVETKRENPNGTVKVPSKFSLSVSSSGGVIKKN